MSTPHSLFSFQPIPMHKSLLLTSNWKHILTKVILFLNLISRSLLTSSISISQEESGTVECTCFLHISWYMHCTNINVPLSFTFNICKWRNDLPRLWKQILMNMICLLYIFQIVNVFLKKKTKVKTSKQTNKNTFVYSISFLPFSRFSTSSQLPMKFWTSSPSS